MSTPHLYFGSAAGKLLQVGSGHEDDGVAIDILGQTRPYAPGGIGGEATFNWLYFRATHQLASDVDLIVTPVLDEVDQEAITVTLTAAAARKGETFRLSLMQGHSEGGVEVLRYAPRGEAVGLRFETNAGIAAEDLIVDRLEVDADIEVDARDTENAT